MKTMRHLVAGLVLFAVLIGLLVNVYTGLEDPDGYNITRDDNSTLSMNISGTVSSGNIVEQFRKLDLIEGIATLENGILSITPSAGSEFDIRGGLINIGVGAAKIISGIVTIPIEMVTIVGTFYGDETGGMLLGSLVMIVVVYVGFILLSAYLGKDI